MTRGQIGLEAELAGIRSDLGLQQGLTSDNMLHRGRQASSQQIDTRHVEIAGGSIARAHRVGGLTGSQRQPDCQARLDALFRSAEVTLFKLDHAEGRQTGRKLSL